MMRYFIYFLIILLYGCQNQPRDSYISQGYTLPLDSLNNYDSTQPRVLNSDYNNSLSIDSNKCIDWAFSKLGDSPQMIAKFDDKVYLICGYKSSYSPDSLDNVIYLNGYCIYEKSDPNTIIYKSGEYEMDLDKIVLIDNKIKITRVINIPLPKDNKKNLMPIYSLFLDPINNKIGTDAIFELNKIKFSQDDLNIYKQMLIDEKMFEDEIFINLILAVNGELDNVDSYKKLGPYAGYLGPIYESCVEFYNIYLRQKNGL